MARPRALWSQGRRKQRSPAVFLSEGTAPPLQTTASSRASTDVGATRTFRIVKSHQDFKYLIQCRFTSQEAPRPMSEWVREEEEEEEEFFNHYKNDLKRHAHTP